VTGKVIELTDHQRKIRRLVLECKTTKEIAECMELGYETARTHLDRLRKKAKVSNRTALAVWAVKSGYV
jgi:DNA-binding CsgD family transcriptional regulator